MRNFIVVVVLAAAIALSPAASASEVSINLDDGAQAAIGQLPALLDQCVAGITIHGDASVCRNVSNFMAAFANEVRNSQAIAAKAAAAAAKAAEANKASPEEPAK